MIKKQSNYSYDHIISTANLLGAWREFLKGKRNKPDVQLFQYYLGDNILSLHNDLKNKTYKHGEYYAFNISDPKPRNIHKATVRDRLLHRAVYRVLYPYFDRHFIAGSFSCRRNKGVHKAVGAFRMMAFKVSKNYTKTACVLKCDIKKFFASIDHDTLLQICRNYIKDEDIIGLLRTVVGSFDSGVVGKGVPLGNLTSQLLSNVYLNELDRFVKDDLKAEYYIRYADDFVVMSRDRAWLENLIPQINNFLQAKLKLNLHPDKVYIKTLASGVDFLGWVHFSDHRVIRPVTKRRMMRNLGYKPKFETIQSYLGLLRHGNTQKLRIFVDNTSLSC